jgi:hypothetical protein
LLLLLLLWLLFDLLAPLPAAGCVAPSLLAYCGYPTSLLLLPLLSVLLPFINRKAASAEFAAAAAAAVS